MLKTLKKFLFPLLCLILSVGISPREVIAESASLLPINDVPVPVIVHSDYPFMDESGLYILPENWRKNRQTEISSGSSPESRTTSPADTFGYVWDDAVPLEWIDTSSGTEVDLTGASSGQHTGPIALDFSFPYYENSYDQVYIAASGFISFSEANNWPNQSQIPTPSEPNNVIAPYWAPLYLSTEGPSGKIFYTMGGDAPNRYFVVEWLDVAGGNPQDPNGGDDNFHFQVILYESGDIRFQYDQMTYQGGSYCGAAGIEDVTGEDGLTYLSFCSPAPSEQAVLFTRPEPAPRLRVTPHYQSDFIGPGESLSFSLRISNLGDLGEDTFEITHDAQWQLELFESDGSTPLVDSNGDRYVDTGPIAQQATMEVIVKVTAPVDAVIGANEYIMVTATSSLDSMVSQSIDMHLAVPARFTQIFRDDADGAMSLFLAQPQGQLTQKVTGNGWWGYNPAVLETNAGDFLYLWQRWRYLDSILNYVSELEFRLIDHAGDPQIAATRLTDHSTSDFEIYDEEPVLAQTPDGTIGVTWRRRVLRESASGVEENWNIYFALLNETGTVIKGPINLTHNEAWYQSQPETTGVPRFWNVRIAANEENEFGLIWHRSTQESPAGSCSSNCSLDDVYFTLISSSGSEIKAITRLTNDSLSGSEGYSAPAIQALSGGRWLLVYSHLPGGMAFSVVDQMGDLIQGKSFIGETGWSTVVVQPKDSEIALIAWTAWTSNNPQIHLAVINTQTYQKISGPTLLTNPAALTGGDFASFTTDARGNAILTWMDFNANSRRHLYYAYLSGDGKVLTTPLIFKSAQMTVDDPNIETGFSGYSNSAYRQFVDVPLDHWAAGWIERLYDVGMTAGCQADPPLYCPTQATTRAQMAVLLGKAIHGSDFIPPEPTGIFEDVPVYHWAAGWIEQLYEDGITSGCSMDPLRFCLDKDLTRAEMAIFLLRVLNGQAYSPPPAVGIFNDVPRDHWAAAWIEDLYNRGITSGCGTDPLQFCPEGLTTRAQVAVFLGRTFDIP